MAYRLAIYNGEEYVEPIGYMHRDDYDEKILRDVERYTASFENEEELKNVLLEQGNIRSTEGECAINFYKSKKAKPVRLDYGVPFAPEKKYFKREIITNYISAKFINKDFMSLFSEKYVDKYKEIEYFRNDLLCIEEIYKNYLDKEYLPLNYSFYIENFVNKFTTHKDKNGKIILTPRRLSELAMFIIDYERSLKALEPESIYDNIEALEKTKAELKYYRSLLTKQDISLEQKAAYEKLIYDREKKLMLERK